MSNEPLNRLEERAKALNLESDTLSKSIKAIEDQLNHMGLGVEAEQDGWGFGKVDRKKWCFYKVQGEERRPVIECPRKERVEFVRVLEKLLDELSRKAYEETNRMEEANSIVASQMRRLDSQNK